LILKSILKIKNISAHMGIAINNGRISFNKKYIKLAIYLFPLLRINEENR
jgi:hypothetical protein